MLLGALASGLGIYAFQAIAARALQGELYAPVAVLWTLQYLAFAVVLHPGETLVADEATRHGVQSVRVRGAVLTVLAVSAALAVVTTAVSLLLADRMLSSQPGLAWVAGGIVIVYGGFATVRGLLVGQGRTVAYAWLTGVDAMLRVLIALVVVVVGATTERIAWTLPSGAAVGVVWYLLQRPRVRGSRFSGRPVGAAYLTHAAGAAVAAQSLLAGAPLLVAVSGAGAADVSTAFVTFTLARAPLVLGFGGLLAQVLPIVAKLREDDTGAALAATLRRVLIRSGVLAVACGVAGAAVGPAVVSAVFGPDLRPPVEVVAVVAVGSVLAGTAMLLTQAGTVLGLGRTITLAWTVALAAAGFTWWVTPGGPLGRAAVAFASGESIAVLGLLVLARRASRSHFRMSSGAP